MPNFAGATFGGPSRLPGSSRVTGPGGYAPAHFGTGTARFGGGALPGTAVPGTYKPPRAKAPAQPPAAPAPAPAATAPTTTTTQPAPYDSTYYIDLASATARANQQINNYQTDIANGQTGLNNALTNITYNQGQSVHNAQDAENARGGFAQGALGQTVGQINKAALDQQSAQTLKFQQDSQNWNSAIAAVRQGMSLEQIALALASADRLAALNAKSGGTVAGTTTTTPGTTPGTTPAPTPATAPSTAQGGLSTPHTGPNMAGVRSAPRSQPPSIARTWAKNHPNGR